jgi:hypothetical protein
MNEVAMHNGQLPSTQVAGPAQEILSSDLIVPKLLLMQGLSDLVAERKAVMGDMVRNTTAEKLGDDKSAPIEFIPLKVTTDWTEKERVGTKFEYRRTIPRTANNEMFPWSYWRNAQGQEFDKPGQMGATEWQRTKCINVFALLPRDIEAFQAELARCEESGEMPDVSKTVLPVVISFRVMSFNAGKSVMTFLAQVQEMQTYAKNVRHYAYTLPLTCVEDTNDKGTFFVFKVGTPKKLDPKYLPAAERWFNTLSSLKDIKVDNTGETESAPSEGEKF